MSENNIKVNNIKKMNKLLSFLMVVLFGTGLLMIQSASAFESYMGDGLSPYYYFLKQLVILMVGFLAYMTIINIPIKFYEKWIEFGMIIMIMVLFLILTYGQVANNARSWIYLGTFSLQPSEFSKILIILYFACYYKHYKDQLNDLWVAFKPIVLSVAMVFLVILQPDLGTALIMLGIIGSLMFLVPISNYFKKKIFWVMILLASVLLVVGLSTDFVYITAGQKLRFNFLEPCASYQQSNGYQVCNGFIAMNNGGLLGRGIGNSTQKFLYLPFGYTDFIFAIIVEELGLLISMSIILTMFILVYLIYKISKMTNDISGKIICYGVDIYILLHLFINLFGILGMIPLTGVPLPFMSYGGSFSLSLILGLALVQRVYIESVKIKKIPKIKN